jgi:hypothetical protein
MKAVSLALAALSVFASLASAGVVITKITQDQVIEKNADDCFFGVTTPHGCGYVSLALSPTGIAED